MLMQRTTLPSPQVTTPTLSASQWALVVVRMAAQWADDPNYPLKFSTFAFEIGINFVIYGMSH